MSEAQESRQRIIRVDQLNAQEHIRERFILPKLQANVVKQIELWGKRFKPNSKVLDVGCGLQPYRDLITKNSFEYVSFDVVQNSLNSTDFIGQIDGCLPVELQSSGPFDMILVTEVMEHVLDWNNAFRNLEGLLKPGGEVFLTCPYFFPLHEEPFDYWRPTEYALKKLSQNFRFKVINCERLGSSTDCLGLLVGHLINGMKYQTPNSVFEKVSISLKQRFIKMLLLGLHSLISKGFFEKNFSDLKDFYVSNSLTLEKQT